jgi:hypothetical protein
MVVSRWRLPRKSLETKTPKKNPWTSKSQKWTSYPTDTRQNLRLKIHEEPKKKTQIPKAKVRSMMQIPEYALHCLLMRSHWRWAHRHAKNWMSGLVAVKYRSDPIMLRYSFWSTCSHSLSALRAIVILIGVTMALESSILNFLIMSLVYFGWCMNVPCLDFLIRRPRKN